MPSSPTPSPTALQTAAGLIAAGRAVDAARELNALVREAPTYAAAHVLLAKAREASGDRVRALDAWHKAYFLVPSSPLVGRERQRLMDAIAQEKDRAAGSAPRFTPAEPDDPEPVVPPIPPPAAPLADAVNDEADLLPPLGTLPPTPQTPTDLHGEEGWDVVQEEEQRPDPEPPHRVDVPDLVPPGEDLSAYLSALPETDDITDAFEVSGAPTLDDDLDNLIRDLSDAPRIRPDPEYSGPEERGIEAENEEVASETLAKIYEAQKQYAQAADVYEKLARQSPDRAAELRRRAEELRQRAS
ncbi:MAG TPA: hypothetical protein EYQ24_09240 [Bacteroidetes bacterium]|nr:hypothetical protein [Bacteroidota bacterium]